jgi:hypothetical protein
MVRVFSRITAMIIPVFMLIISGTACGPATSPPENNNVPAEPAQINQSEPVLLKPAEFQTGELTIQPVNVMVDDMVTVSTQISNIGDEPGEYTAVFSINGEEIDRQVLSIDGMESEDVSFQYTNQDAGEYEYAIDDSLISVTVYDWTPCEIKYDKGVIKQEAYYYLTDDNGHILFFSPETSAFKIQKVRVCGLSVVGNLNELKVRQFTVSIWDKNMHTKLWSADFPWKLFKGSLGWIDIEVPDIRVDDEFIVEFVSHSEPPRLEGARQIYTVVALAWEQNESEEIRSGMIVDGNLYTSPDHNWFIRVEGECNKIN